LNDIAKLINCKFALIGIDEKENKIICGNWTLLTISKIFDILFT
jgi:hypothetical protein